MKKCNRTIVYLLLKISPKSVKLFQGYTVGILFEANQLNYANNVADTAYAITVNLFDRHIMEHCIVYTSSSNTLFQEADLASILEQSRHDNALKGISGILLINKGTIIQVLEGKKEIIEALHERIEQDPRHMNVIKLVDSPIEKRSFVDSSMASGNISIRQLELIKEILNLGRRDWLMTVVGELSGLIDPD